MEVPYDFINILAFSILKKYENKNSLTIDNLNNFYYAFLENGTSNLNAEYENSEEELVLEVGDDLEEGLNNFLINFGEYFYLKDNVVYLNSEVSYDTLTNLAEVLINEYDIPEAFLEASEFPEVLRTLEIHTIYDALQNYLTNERKIFLQYKHQDFKSKSNMFLRAMFCYNAQNLPNEVIMAMENISYYMAEEDPNYDYNLNPISLNVWKTYENVRDEDEILEKIYEGMQFAIFGKGTLINLKLYKLFTDILDEKFDENNNNEIEFAFYLKYLEKIDNYLEKYGIDDYLVKAKWRLLYMLDSPELSLYKEENLFKIRDEIKVENFDMASFRDFTDECYFLAREVFETDQNRYTLRKLLFIATYYELTKDAEIIAIINKYSQDEMYNLYCQIIFDLDKNKELKKEK